LKLPVNKASSNDALPTLRHLEEKQRGNPLVDVCYISDDAELFQCVQYCVGSDLLKDQEQQKLLAQVAIFHDRVSILRHLQSEHDFKIETICKDLVYSGCPIFSERSFATIEFLLQYSGIDKQYLWGETWDTYRQEFDYDAVKTIKLFVNNGIDFVALQDDRKPEDYVGTFLTRLDVRYKSVKKEPNSIKKDSEMREIESLFSSIVPSIEAISETAKKHLEKHKSVEQNIRFIKDNLEQFRLLSSSESNFARYVPDQKKEDKTKERLFDDMSHCFTEATKNGAIPANVLSVQDAQLLLTVGRQLQPKYVRPKAKSFLGKSPPPVDIRKQACDQLTQYIISAEKDLPSSQSDGEAKSQRQRRLSQSSKTAGELKPQRLRSLST